MWSFEQVSINVKSAASAIRKRAGRVVLSRRLLKIIALVGAHLLARSLTAHMPDWSPQMVTEIVALLGSEGVGILALALQVVGFKLKKEDDDTFEYLKQTIKVRQDRGDS